MTILRTFFRDLWRLTCGGKTTNKVSLAPLECPQLKMVKEQEVKKKEICFGAWARSWDVPEATNRLSVHTGATDEPVCLCVGAERLYSTLCGVAVAPTEWR